MIQPVKGKRALPDDLGWIPGILIKEEENQLLQVVL